MQYLVLALILAGVVGYVLYTRGKLPKLKAFLDRFQPKPDPTVVPPKPQDNGQVHQTADGGLSMAGGLVTLTPEQIARRDAQVAAEHSGKAPVDDGDISNGTKTRTLFPSPTVVKFVLRKPGVNRQVNFQTGETASFHYEVTGPIQFGGDLTVQGGVIQSFHIPDNAPLGEYKLTVTAQKQVETMLTQIG